MHANGQRYTVICEEPKNLPSRSRRSNSPTGGSCHLPGRLSRSARRTLVTSAFMGRASKKKAQRRQGIGPSRADIEVAIKKEHAKRRVDEALAGITETAGPEAAEPETAGAGSWTGAVKDWAREAPAALWGSATPVAATVPKWAEGSLGDYFFTEPSVTKAAQLPPLSEAVLPTPETLAADSRYSAATSSLLVRAVVLDGVPASDAAITAVIDLLTPLVEREMALDRHDKGYCPEDAIQAPLWVIGVDALLEATRSVIADDRIAPVLALLESRLAPVLAPLNVPGPAAARALVCAVAHHYFFENPEDTETLNRLDEDRSTSENALETLIKDKDLVPADAIRAGLAMLAVLADLCRTNAKSALG